MKIITRFAPSPTGYLHIGGCRTALFNWLYAKKNNGLFLLRIENTDEDRNVPEAISAIISGMKWLGINYDQEIVFQNERKNRHTEVIYKLLELGHAYWCNCPKQIIHTEIHRCDCKHKQLSKNDNSVVRFSVPQKSTVSYCDAVYGNINVQSTTISDIVIMRSNGLPTYMLAVVVDDYDMGITHVIRGNDHIPNTPKQIMIYNAMSWNVPVFAHLPLLHDEFGKKLSKRHSATDINDYRDLFLPETMRNYLLKLGWGSGDHELIDDKLAIELFDLSGIGVSASNVDYKKLVDMNKHYLLNANIEILCDIVVCSLEKILERTLTSEEKELINKAIPLFQHRGGTNREFAESMSFFVKSPTLSDEAKLIIQENNVILGEIIEKLQKTQEWTKKNIVFCINNIKAEKSTIYKLLRSCLVGKMEAPSIIEIMLIFGKEKCTSRIIEISPA